MDNQTNKQKASVSMEYTIRLLEEIGTRERHFDEVVVKLKTLASTWMLAVFGAIGFILANKIERPLLFAAGVGIAGATGIFLLWFIDIKIYQKFLSVNFHEGRKIEGDNPWLPQIRNGIVNSQETGGASANLSWFYVMCICSSFLVAVYCAGAYLLIESGVLFYGGFMAFGGLILGILAFGIRYKSTEDMSGKSSRHQDIIERNLKKEKNYITYGVMVFYIISFWLVFLIDSKSQHHSVSETGLLRDKFNGMAAMETDSSGINLIPVFDQGGLGDSALPPGGKSKVKEQKDAEEMWLIVSGSGELWRKSRTTEEILKLSPKNSVIIPVESAFQFKNTGSDSLKFLTVKIPQ